MHGNLQQSVLAVPPLARRDDLSPDRAANAALIRHIEQGGVSTLIYGSNANFYNIGLYEYAGILDMLAELAAPSTWVIPAAGPDFGKLIDQAAILRSRPFLTAMVLPAGGAFTLDGVETGIAKFADRLGKPVIIYAKTENYITPKIICRLVERGMIKAIKYAIVRADPADDAFLVTHEMGFARDIADDVVFMDNGQIVEQAAPTHAAADQHRLAAGAQGLRQIVVAAPEGTGCPRHIPVSLAL